MDRRDFLGIIAAPLFRNLVPPTPTGNTLSVAALLGALKELERASVGPPISMTGSVYMRTFPGNPYEHLAKDGQ